MKLKEKSDNEIGLSLIELMIVVAIIGILAALAIPRFQSFQAKARQTEAKTNLNAVYTLQQSYSADKEWYAILGDVGFGHDNGNGNEVTKCNSANDIGFSLTDCRKVRYRYTTRGRRPDYIPLSRNSRPILLGTAHSGGGQYGHIGPNLVFPGCDIPDVWTISTEKTLTNEPGLSADFSDYELAIKLCI